MAANNVHIEMFFDKDSSTFSYVVTDNSTKVAAIIDPVLNYDAAAGVISTTDADNILAYIAAKNLTVAWILETHAHADHLSAAHYLHVKTGAPVAIGEGIRKVQQTFKLVFNLNDDELLAKGDYFDKLFADNERFSIGNLTAQVINTPGHTNDSVSYLIEGNLFVGDSLFMPDAGTARCDFPGGDAATLYNSVQKLYQLPEQTRMFLCHDYKAPGRDEFVCETTIAAQKQQNIHLKQGTSEKDFVAMRTTRDKTLSMPKLILPSVQVNVRAGQFPAAEDNGTVYLKLPLNLFR